MGTRPEYGPIHDLWTIGSKNQTNYQQETDTMYTSQEALRSEVMKRSQVLTLDFDHECERLVWMAFMAKNHFE